MVLAFIALWIYAKYTDVNSETNWHVEKNAVPSKSHPLSGFYKYEDCKEPWGWAVGAANEREYYISFCGPGGCFAEGTYRANTTIYNDPKYEVIDKNTIKFLTDGKWTTHVRCPSGR